MPEVNSRRLQVNLGKQAAAARRPNAVNQLIADDLPVRGNAARALVNKAPAYEAAILKQASFAVHRVQEELRGQDDIVGVGSFDQVDLAGELLDRAELAEVLGELFDHSRLVVVGSSDGG